MKISVVMSTYNGEKYIEEQLESIYMQSRQPDEVLICDDGSSDNTVSLIKQYIANRKLENWKIVQNNSRKGVTLNFLDGAETAIGNIVFYCDQDDIWEPLKIEMVEKGFIDNPNMLACCCLQSYIDSDGNPINIKYQFTYNVPIKSNYFQQVSLEEVIKYNKCPGLCLAVKKALIVETREFILDNALTHDLPIGTIAAIKGGYYLLNRKLVRYRLHDNNTSQPCYTIKNRINNYDKQIYGRIGRCRQMRAIYEKYECELTHQQAEELQQAIVDTDKSIRLMQSKKTLGLFFMLFNRNPMMNRWIALNNLLSCWRSKL